MGDYEDSWCHDELLAALRVKDAEIAELRQQRNEASVLQLRAMRERDEARECVGRLYQIASEHADCLQIDVDNARIARKRENYQAQLDELRAALAVTPEHLRGDGN